MSQQGEQGQGTQGADNGAQGQQGQQGEQITKADLGKKFSEGYNEGERIALDRITKDLKARFNVDSLDALAALVKPGNKEGQGNQGGDVAQVEKLTKQISDLEAKHQADRLSWRIESAMAGFNPHSPTRTAADILQAYEITVDEAGRETVRDRQTREIVIADGKPASVRDLVQLLTKHENFSWQFKQGQGTQAQGAQRKSVLNDDMLKDEKFVEALKITGQYFAFINGKPVDEDAVLAIYKKN